MMFIYTRHLTHSPYIFTDEEINNLRGSSGFRKKNTIKYMAFSEFRFIVENAFTILCAPLFSATGYCRAVGNRMP